MGKSLVCYDQFAVISDLRVLSLYRYLHLSALKFVFVLTVHGRGIPGAHWTLYGRLPLEAGLLQAS